MTRKEFEKIREKFEREQARWDAIQVGDKVYDFGANGIDIDFFEMTVLSVDAEERTMVVRDESMDAIIRDVTSFMTEQEAVKCGKRSF